MTGSGTRAPSSFTASMVPSFSRRTADRTAVSGDASYVPNGRSPTSSGLRAAGRSPQGDTAQRGH